GVGRAGQHVDVGARAEDTVQGARDDDAAHLGVLEAQPLHGVVELEVDAEIVRVELEAVTGAQGPVFLDRHHEPGERPFDRQLPVRVFSGGALERDRRVFRCGLQGVLLPRGTILHQSSFGRGAPMHYSAWAWGPRTPETRSTCLPRGSSACAWRAD